MAALVRQLALLLLLGAALAGTAKAGLFGDSEVEKALKGAEKDVRSLLEIMAKPELPFHHSRARKLLAFEAMAKEEPGKLDVQELDGAEGAYFEFTLTRSLQQLAGYLFNPEVPPHAVYPGAVRMGGWLEPEAARAGLAPLQKPLPDIENPVVYRGMEYEATTPDENSGTYYRYDLNRLVAGFQGPQGPVVLSLSRLSGDSTVGKKGVAFGPPGDWYYFYSGITGNLLSGVGWAESQMYESVSVFVLRQVAAQKTRVGVFKWVKAGWKGMNMVKRKYILKGLKSFRNNLQEVLPASSLPSPGAIAEKAREIETMDEQEMRTRLQPLAELLQESAKTNDTLQREEFQSLISGGYLETLTREEMAAELVKDYMRQALK